MAQVTMDSKEYLGFVDKARQLDSMKRRMVEEIEVRINTETTYHPVHVTFHPIIPQDTMAQIVETVVDTVLAEPKVMGLLVEENNHFLNMVTGLIYTRWDDKPEGDEVDLLQNKKFREAWEAIKQEEKKDEE